MTLIEVTAAVAIAGLVIATAAALLDQVADGGARIGRQAAASLADGNADRLLGRLMLDARPSFDTTDRFVGDSGSAYLRTRCPTANGWAESCHAQLLIDASGDSSALLVALSDGRQTAAYRRRGTPRLRYLDLSSAESTWVERWNSSITIPSAIALVGPSDTIVLPLGVARE